MTDRAKILIVDDRPENLLALEATLGSLDQTLVRAESGEDALRALLKDDFALILLDAQMPGMDGFETAARIKRRTRTKDIPIIFLTAFGEDPNDSYHGYAVGGADFIAKPFDPWVLRAKVQVFVDLWNAGRRLATQAALLRDRIDGPGDPLDLLVTMRNGLADVEAAVTELAEELPTTGSAADALATVRHRLSQLAETLAGLDPDEVVPGGTRRRHG